MSTEHSTSHSFAVHSQKPWLVFSFCSAVICRQDEVEVTTNSATAEYLSIAEELSITAELTFKSNSRADACLCQTKTLIVLFSFISSHFI